MEAVRAVLSDAFKFSVFAYGIGFFIVNYSFLQYGFMSFDIVSTRFLLAGVLFLVVCSLIILALHICKKFQGPHDKFFVYGIGMYFQITSFWILLKLTLLKKDIIFEPSWLFLYLFVLIAFLIPSFSFLIILKMKSRKIKLFVEISLVALPLLFFILYGSKEIKYFGLFIILVAGYKEIFSIQYFKNLKNKFPLNDLNTPRNIMFQIIGFIALPLIFGTQIYPKVDRMRGGGAPLKVSVLLGEEQKAFLVRNLGEYKIDFDNVELINEAGDSIYIGLENLKGKKSAIEISKRNIIGIKYQKTGILFLE
jgi:hypothetical protein